MVFEVNEKGAFLPLFIDAADENVVKECRRVFALLPQVKPATFNGNPTYAKYTVRFSVPLIHPDELPK